MEKKYKRGKKSNLAGPRNKWSVNEHLNETEKVQSNGESVRPIEIIDMLSYGDSVNSKINEIQKKEETQIGYDGESVKSKK